jgi:hypothetical protein
VKVVEFFPPHADVAADRAKGLRVSRYFGDADTPPQVRFSIWSRESAAAAISLDEDEAVRLAAFVAPVRVRKPLLEQLRDSLRI